MNKINNTYEHALACAYFRIDERGILTDTNKMSALNEKINAEVRSKLEQLSIIWNTRVYTGAGNKGKDTDSINLGSIKILEFLKTKGYNIPKIRTKNQETKEIEFKESVAELSIRKMFAESTPQMATPLKIILDIRELNTLQSRYVNAKRHDDIFYSCYNVAGTTTGRRSSKKNCFGLGGNAQNFPKHSTSPFVEEFRKCLIARPGHIFLFVDQISAEEWPVSALSGNTTALGELRNKVDRHTNFASYIFGIPITSKTKEEWKKSLERYLGKKCRHANNYRMQAQLMSDSLAKEGFSVSKDMCGTLLEKAALYDPSIKQVFHTYVQNELFTNHKLTTPLGRERYFLGLRPNDSNHKIINEACAYIPQSTVGDNTGLTVLALDKINNYVIQESHDSICQEVPDNMEELKKVLAYTKAAFDRDITFHNNITINIPIEAEIGYNFENTITLKSYTEAALEEAYEKCQENLRNPG